MDANFEKGVAMILKNDSRYPRGAYQFVNEAVSFTVRALNKADHPRGMRHVSGLELVRGAMEYAVSQYGFLAPLVFDDWNVRSGSDMGAIVYNMIGVSLLSASEEDSRSDFDCCPELVSELHALIRQRSAPENAEETLPLPVLDAPPPKRVRRRKE